MKLLNLVRGKELHFGTVALTLKIPEAQSCDPKYNWMKYTNAANSVYDYTNSLISHCSILWICHYCLYFLSQSDNYCKQ